MTGYELTYAEALELAAKLYTGRRKTEMALHGYPDYCLPRVPEADRPSAEAMLAELKETSRAMTAVTRRGRGYAIKFCLDSDSEPEDKQLAKVLGHCVRAPKPEWYPLIRSAVSDYRAGVMQDL